jgi:predicted CoA-substrate-specific enzyme activase
MSPRALSGKTAAAIGVDVGSTTWKAVALSAAGELIAAHLEPAHPQLEAQTERALASLRALPNVGDLPPLGATGYGRKRVSADRVLTEITCHARGAFAAIRRSGLLIDMGGQDTKAIHFDADGRVLDFAMNDKCAAGTGRFLEVIAARLRIPLEAIAETVASSTTSTAVSSTCTVFAESEVISLVAQGKEVASILHGIHVALAARVVALAARVAALAAGPMAGIQPQRRGAAQLCMSGGVALNLAMVRALEAALGASLQILPEPQLIGAVGAALAVLPRKTGHIQL